MKRPQSSSHLHLQLGQEVIYLLLAVFGLLSLVLALLLTTNTKELTAAQIDAQKLRERIVFLDDENKRLQAALTFLGDRSDQAVSLAERLRIIERRELALRAEVEALRTENDRLREQLRIASADLSALSVQMNNKPPIINLKETEGFSFPLGEATLTKDFRDKLSNEAVPAFLDAAKRFNATVIEVIGHTDELAIAGRVSNLDVQLIPFLRAARSGGAATPALIASDNTGLGMARAAAVAQFLMSDARLRDFQILPMSAAQLIKNDDTVSIGSDVKEAGQRRRIELRARRSNY